MTVVSRYFITSLSALLPLINPPGSAVEILGIVGLGSKKVYQRLARKVALNATLLLAGVCFAGPYLLRCFGISVEIFELIGGFTLIVMAWGMLRRKKHERECMESSSGNIIANDWESHSFYPLTYPVTVGPCAVTVILTLSAQARGLMFSEQLWAFAGMVLCLLLMSALIYVSYTYAPVAAQAVSPRLMQGTSRLMPFLLFCVGGRIAWNGLHSLLSTIHV